MEDTGQPIAWHVAYMPDRVRCTSSGDSKELLVHKIGTLVTAPHRLFTLPVKL